MLFYLCKAPTALEKYKKSDIAICVYNRCKIWLKFYAYG